MRVIAFDTETDLIRPGQLAPPLVCLTYQELGQPARIVADLDAIRAIVAGWLDDPGVRLVGANVAYDLAVLGQEWPELLPSIWRAYEDDRIADVQIRQRLLDIAAGVYMGRFASGGVFVKHTYDLAALYKRCAGGTLTKDEWRLSYGRFRGLPLERWRERAVEVQGEARAKIAEIEATWAGLDPPKEVRARLESMRSMSAADPSRCTEYPLEDARATLAVYLVQQAHDRYLADEYRQARAAWWLHLSSAWGLRTDARGVEILRRETEAELEDLRATLRAAGLVRADGSRDTKAAKARMIRVCAEEGLRLRRTDGHATPGKCKVNGAPCPDGAEECDEHISLDADACNATEDEILVAYAAVSEAGKVLANDVAALEGGVLYPLHTRYGLAETGRTTSSRPNIQNIRRRPGIREAFVPRPGCVFVQADYPTLELYTLAQCCVSWLGESKLAEALRAGVDPHLLFASHMLRITYEEAAANKKRPDVKQARQLAKDANFGFPGGMGIAKFVAATRKQMSREDFEAAFGATEEAAIERARQLKAEWFAAWPEMPRYFARVNAACETISGKAQVETLFTGRHRGGASYCAAANNGFQGLAADAAKRAGWLISRAQYVERASPLYGTRTVAFVHDEFILEVPEGREDAAARELARLMCVGANELLPDVPIAIEKLEPLAMRRWSKDAAQILDADGRIVPWSP